MTDFRINFSAPAAVTHDQSAPLRVRKILAQDKLKTFKVVFNYDPVDEK